jgi:serine/threonine protein kinase
MQEQRKIKLGKPLGSGQFGRVYRGTLDGTPCIVKIVSEQAAFEQELRGATIMNRLHENGNNPHFCQMIQFDEKKRNLVYTNVLDATLEGWVKSSILPNLTIDSLTRLHRVFQECERVYEIMIANNINHLDIHGGNIMLKLDGDEIVVAFIDYGAVEDLADRGASKYAMFRCFSSIMSDVAAICCEDVEMMALVASIKDSFLL